MMTLLWIVAAQPLVFAVIFAVLGRRRARRFSTRHQHSFRQSISGVHEPQTKFTASPP